MKRVGTTDNECIIFIENARVIYCNRNCRNCRLLFTLPMAQRGPFRLVAHSGSNKLSFICLLITLHPAESGRVYAAYGGIYVLTAIVWLRIVDKSPLSNFDLIGTAFVLTGMGILVYGWR